eukprot:219966_1
MSFITVFPNLLIMSQNKNFGKKKKNKNDTQFDSGSLCGWWTDENKNKTPVLILGGGDNGTLLHIWNGTTDTYCDTHTVKTFHKNQHKFVQKLLLSSYELFNEKEKAIKEVKKLKSVEKKEKDNKEWINAALMFTHEKMKWKKFKTSHGYTYCPVFVVQDLVEKPLIVLDIWGKYWNVRNRTELVEFPLTTEISSHIELLKRICEIHAARLPKIEIGKTRCQWQEDQKTFFGNKNIVQCQGLIRHFAKVKNSQYNVVVKRYDNGGLVILNSDQITILRDETPGQNNTEDKIQTFKLLTTHLQHENAKLLAEKKEQDQAVEEIQKEKTILKKEKQVLDIKMSVLNREKSENEQLVTTLRERLIDTSVALDLSDGFPLAADIVKHYETIKTQFHHEASKAIKYSLKSNDKRLSKVQYLKCASQLLFDILLKSYNEMKMLEKRQLKKIADDEKINIENKTIPIKIQKQLRQSYQEVINQVKTDTADIISSQCIKQNQLDEILKQEARDAILSYTINCVEVCWEITLSRDPKLKIEPLKFETNEKITFDDNIHEAGPRSEVDECLNFIIWPAIYRTDTNQNLSLIIAVFLNHIPSCMKQNQLDELRHEESVDMDIEKDDNNNNDNENAPDAPIEIDYVQINSAANAQKYTV